MREMAPPLPRIPEDGHHHQCEKSRVEGVGDDNPPDTRLAPEKVQEIVLAAGIELPGILPHHEILKNP